MSTNGLPSFTDSPRNHLALGLVLVLLGTLYAVRLGEVPIGAVTDDAYYVEMARSTAEGLGPVINTGPDSPARDPEIFPPGFPLLLSPLAKILPDSLQALKAVPLLGALLLLPLCWWLPGPTADIRLRLAIMLLVMFNPWVVSWSGRILSDIPFTALSLGALLLFVKLQEKNDSAFWLSKLALVMLCVTAVSVRTIGWAAVLAMSAVLLTQRRWLSALILPGLVAAGLLLISLSSPAGGDLISQGYLSQMFSHGGAPAWSFVLRNILYYVIELPVILVPVFGKPVEAAMQSIDLGRIYELTLVLVGLKALFLSGFALKKLWPSETVSVRAKLLAFYLVIYGAVLAQFDGYPSGVQTRLLIPVLPIVVWLVLVGMQEKFGSKHPWLPKLVVGLMLLAALAHNGWRVARPLHSSVEADGHGLVDPSRGASWLAENAEAGAIIMAQEPLVRHIHFQLPVVGVAGGEPAAVAWIIAEFAPSYLFIGPEVHGSPRQLEARGQVLLTLARSQPEVFEPVFEDRAESIHIFRIRQP